MLTAYEKFSDLNELKKRRNWDFVSAKGLIYKRKNIPLTDILVK